MALRAVLLLFARGMPAHPGPEPLSSEAGRTPGPRPGVPDRLAEAMEALAAFTADVTPAATATRDDLDRIAQQLRGRLRDGPFPALLATQRWIGAEDQVTEPLLAWVLAAALIRMRDAPGENAIQAALRNMRLLIAQDAEVFADLAPLPATLPEIVLRLRRLEERPDLPVRLSHRLASIRYLLDAWNRRQPAIFRTGRDRTAEPAAEAQEEDLRPVRTAPWERGVTGLTGGFPPVARAVAGPVREQEADTAAGRAPVIVVEDLDDIAPGPELRGRTRRILRRVATRALALPAEHDPMTPHECRVLVARLTGPEAPQGRGRLLASLVFGLPLDIIEAARSTAPGPARLVQGTTGLALGLTHALPEPVLIEELRSRAPEEELILPAPQELDPGTLVDPTGAEDILRGLRHHLARPLTLGRIARHKSVWLRRAGADAALIGFLTGVDPARRAQMHYTAARTADLQAWHARYVREGLGLTVATDAGGPGGVVRLRDPAR